MHLLHFIILHIYLLLNEREHLSYTLSKFQLHTTMLSITVTIFNLRSPDPIRPTTGNVYPFTGLPPLSAHPPHPLAITSLLCLYESDFIFNKCFQRCI